MTIHEVAEQVHQLSGGHINRQYMNCRRIEGYIRGAFKDPAKVKAGNRIIMSITLPDGDWLFTVDRYIDSKGHECYGYTIPETRREEYKIKDLLLGI